MKTYLVGYDGNSTRFQGRTFEVLAENEREAVEQIYMEYLDDNYFPQEDGSILDCQGNIIAEADDDTIEYDGGCFSVYYYLDNMSFERQ